MNDSEYYDDATLENAIKKFQFNFALEQTGIFNYYTNFEMSRPRCGLGDFKRNQTTRTKRYHIKGPKWEKTHLTWR